MCAQWGDVPMIADPCTMPGCVCGQENSCRSESSLCTYPSLRGSSDAE